jgi:hypothetical protein
MNLCPLFLFAVAGASLLVDVGCRTATISTAQTAVQDQKPITVKIPGKNPPKPSMSGAHAKTFHVTLPVAFRQDELPQQEIAEFQLTGKAGQILLVKLSNENLFVTIQRPEPSFQLLVPVMGGDAHNRLYALPKTGSYQFALDAGSKTSVQLNFLPSNDPMIDQGLGPDHFSVNLKAFAGNEQLVVVPYTLEEGEDYYNSWPAHLAVEKEHFEFRIIPVAGYEEIFKKDGKESGMKLLEIALRTGSKNVDVERLPYPIYRFGGINMAARRDFFEGEGWHGLRWIGGFGQDSACRPELGYVFEGISDDGRYFIMIRADVSHSATKQRWHQNCTTDEKAPRINAALDHDLAVAAPESFQPSLNRLDTVISSLKFKH